MHQLHTHTQFIGMNEIEFAVLCPPHTETIRLIASASVCFQMIHACMSTHHSPAVTYKIACTYSIATEPLKRRMQHGESTNDLRNRMTGSDMKAEFILKCN